jgi:hypothetical protein
MTIASVSLTQKSHSPVMIGSDAFDASVACCVKGVFIVVRSNVDIRGKSWLSNYVLNSNQKAVVGDVESSVGRKVLIRKVAQQSTK